MPEDSYFHHHTRDELVAKAQQGYAVVVPLASTEQHGHHLPVFTDSLVCNYVTSESVKRAAEQVPVIVTPVLTIGCSAHHLRYGGTLSFRSATYISMLKDIGESLVTDGFRKIIFLNGHGGNHSIMAQAANDLVVKYDIWVAFSSITGISKAALEKANIDEDYLGPHHAGVMETSMIMALRPDLVREEYIGTDHPRLKTPPYYTNLLHHGELTGIDGYTDAPGSATAEKGQRYLEATVEAVTQWLVAVFRDMDHSSAADIVR